jgi:hypothetical protein
MESAYAQANTVFATNGKMESAYAQANTVFATNGKMESAFTQANTAITNVSATNGKMESAFSTANSRVPSITGTSNQVLVNGGSGTAVTSAATLSLPQNIHTTTTTFQVGGMGVGTDASGVAGEIRATNNITAFYSSDKKFKENVETIPNAVETVNVIGGKLFDWTDAYLEAHGGQDDYFNQKSDFGVIAQDVQSVFPRAVRTRPDGSLAVDYEKLVALAFAAIKELSHEIEDLKKK